MTSFKVGGAFYPKVPIVQQPYSNVSSAKKSDLNTVAFKAHLQQASEKPKLTFSQHAQLRLAERDITLSDEQIERLNDGMSRAEAKGAKESIFLLEDLAFVVSVKNNTVITAMNQQEMQEQVITNIDSAVLLS